MIASSRYCEIGRDAVGFVFSFSPTPELTMGSTRLARDLCRRVGLMIRRSKFAKVRIAPTRVEATFEPIDEEEIGVLVNRIDVSISQFRRERLHPRIVEDILGITSRERLRWIKDGRLPTSGSGSFRRGRQDIHFPLHPPDRIAAIARNPEVIAVWRAADAAADGAAIPAVHSLPQPANNLLT